MHDGDDGLDFPPTRHPVREAITMAIAAAVAVVALAVGLVAATYWLTDHVTVTFPCRPSTINQSCQ